MDENYKDLEIKLESAYYNRNKVGTRVDKVDLVDAAKVIEDDLLTKIGDISSSKSVAVAQTIADLQVLPIENKIVYCNESSMLYRYRADITSYIQYGDTVISSDFSGGWVEYDSYNKFLKFSTIIDLAHLNQSSSMILTADEDFTAKADTLINNGHTHVCKLFCNGFTPTFSGFTFMSDSSPLDIATIDTTSGYYHTIIFFKVAGDNKYIILEKVLSTDVTPPTITVSIASKSDVAITYTINSDENSELKWALYAGGSTNKTTSDIDAGTGALQHGVKYLASGNNTLTITSLSELTTYDLWQYAFDSIPNNSTPAKTTVQTNETGVSQLVAPILETVTVLSPTSLSVPIATSSIDANASSVSLYYKRATDPTYTLIPNIGKTDVSYTLSALDVNTQYYIYLVAVGDGISYSDSVASNITTPTTQNIAPTLSVPYTSSSGLIIELPFSRAMANPSAQAGLFTPSGGKSVVSVALKSGDATKIQVTVNSAYIYSDSISISIASGLIPSDNGVVFVGVNNQSVTNNIGGSLFVNNTFNYPKSSIIGMPTSITTPYSVGVWLKNKTAPSYANILSFNNSTRPNDPVVRLMLTPDNRIGYQIFDNYSNSNYRAWTTTLSQVLFDTWQHIGIVWNGSVAKLYINGISVQLTAGSAGVFSEIGLPTHLNIGTYGQYAINGNVQDVSVFNRALTNSEMLEVGSLNDGKCINLLDTTMSSDLSAYYRLINNVVDSASINTITPVGTLSYTSDKIV